MLNTICKYTEFDVGVAVPTSGDVIQALELVHQTIQAVPKLIRDNFELLLVLAKEALEEPYLLGKYDIDSKMATALMTALKEYQATSTRARD